MNNQYGGTVRIPGQRTASEPTRPSLPAQRDRRTS
ncbi:hypothetical protein STIB_73480 [Streptomyces sp. IB2014 011-1]|nr:hypothetical protein STIB_73480 [Streptomyces sp. IB2014 011-1]